MENIKVLFENGKLKIEQIISYGEVSPVGFWYDNDIDEWVSLTVGTAVLEFADNDIELKAGDSFYITAKTKHRVKYTSVDCVWLCVYVK